MAWQGENLPRAYYNEIEPYCVEWLRNLIAAGLIPDGDVDSRSIEVVSPDDLAGYTQCHFFAGLGGWAYAARLAGWPDERPIWTGSCPCQPFSVAGKGGGTDDPRHLWPHLHRLVRGGRPPVVMGEQVAGAAGYDWFHGVRADLATEGYHARAVDIPACAVNAPHRRNRLYWVADTAQERHERGGEARGRRDGSAHCGCGCRCCSICGPVIDAKHAEFMRRYPFGFDDPAYDPFRLSDPAQHGRREERADAGRRITGDRAQGWSAGLESGGGDDLGISDANYARLERRSEHAGEYASECASRARGADNAWSDWQLIGPDRDGKYRRIKPGITPLAPRLPGYVGQLRSYGNAINAELAAEVIRAYMDVTQ